MFFFILLLFFFFNDTATTEIYTLSYTTLFRSRIGAQRMLQLDAVSVVVQTRRPLQDGRHDGGTLGDAGHRDRKSTRLNSSHTVISYAVFCLKKKKKKKGRKNKNNIRTTQYKIK